MRVKQDNIFDSRIPGGIFFTHSVKTPLTALQLNLEEMLEVACKNNDTQLKNSLECALLASQQITDLVTNIPRLDNPCHNSCINVAKTLRDLKILFKNKNNSYQLIFNIYLKNNCETLKINQLYFVELMSCMIKNGFEAYAENHSNKVVILTVVEKNNQLHVQVQDFGQGLGPIHASVASMRGFSTKEDGMGFGMWFVKRIVEQHFRRKLKIFSETDGGTIIKFSLPIEKEKK